VEEQSDARMITTNVSTLRRLMLFFCKVGRYHASEEVIRYLTCKNKVFTCATVWRWSMSSVSPR